MKNKLSSRGLRLIATRFHLGREAPEKRPQVVRTGTRLGMPLERERRPVGALEALQRAVEEGAVGRADVRRQTLLLDLEAVVLARDQHSAGVDLEHRMIGAVVPELHLRRLAAAREPEQLVPEADAEGRHAD